FSLLLVDFSLFLSCCTDNDMYSDSVTTRYPESFKCSTISSSDKFARLLREEFENKNVINSKRLAMNKPIENVRTYCFIRIYFFNYLLFLKMVLISSSFRSVL